MTVLEWCNSNWRPLLDGKVNEAGSVVDSKRILGSSSSAASISIPAGEPTQKSPEIRATVRVDSYTSVISA